MKAFRSGDPKKEQLKEATVYADDKMALYNKAFEYLKSGENYRRWAKEFGYDPNLDNWSRYGLRDYNAFMKANKEGFYDSPYGDSNRTQLRKDLHIFKTNPYTDETSYLLKEDIMPDYVKEGLKKGMEIDFVLEGAETPPVYFFKKPKQIQEKVRVTPKRIKLSNNKMELKKPVEEEILDIKYSQGGDKVKVSTNFGDKIMSRRKYVDYYKKNRDKIQSFRKKR